ncbi:NYN domain-containing protein [Nocardioides zeae]|uniref:NYN domain-containing protein n=1 Tax=Nocardioides imazamoxiresistens TaxID=3231893 RepID=A0ABU3PX44_9ACTN|nr:NYN domain-containing protein [Nocardioides zeae]MDT9593801.1 NYN domain-containing protein [Nocardioides zeae]
MTTDEPTTAAPGTPGTPATPGLTEPVRARLVQVAAQLLPAVGVLPAPLRRVAAFAPQRRARLGGAQILAALADDDLRERVATQAAARGSTADLLRDAGEPATDPVAHDPLDVAALLWLQRPEGWEQAYAAALARHDEAVRSAEAAGDAETRDRLERRVEVLGDELAAQRAEHKEQLDEARAENTLLRRRLGETRAALRGAQGDAERATEQARAAEQRSTAAVAAAESESRRLRRQLAEAQAQAAQHRSEHRADREDATLRTRLLLDTVVDAAQGLRRELGLPAAEGSPAARYEQALAGEGARTTSASGALGTGSPALLEQLLAMPRARLLVDGYNVSKQTWGSASLEVQRMRLVNGIAPIVARSGAETTVVFDAASSPTRPVVAAPRGVRVAFSPEHVIADDVIRDLVALEPEGRMVVVVTSDQALARDVRRAGATVMDSVALAGLLTR